MPIFFGVEGKSEQAFVAFLHRLCDENKRNLTLDCAKGSGGSTMMVVHEAKRALMKRSDRSQFKERLILLDRDRVAEDQKAGFNARATASKAGFTIIWELLI